MLSVASGDFFCSKIRKYARRFTLPALRKQQRDERDGDDAANRGDERHLGDERRIAAVFRQNIVPKLATGIAMTTVLMSLT